MECIFRDVHFQNMWTELTILFSGEMNVQIYLCECEYDAFAGVKTSNIIYNGNVQHTEYIHRCKLQLFLVYAEFINIKFMVIS